MSPTHEYALHLYFFSFVAFYIFCYFRFVRRRLSFPSLNRSSQTTMDDHVGPNLSHPDSLIRLTSTVLRFRCPTISEKAQKVDFVKSFKTVGTHVTTQKVTKTADSSRDYLNKALKSSKSKKNVAHKTIASAAEKYLTPIHQLLLACRLQPESARLDRKYLSWV